MTRTIFFSLILGIFFTACQSGSNNNEATTAPKVDANKASEKTTPKASAAPSHTSTADRLLKLANGNAETEKVAESIKNLIGSNMISSIDLNSGQLTVNYFGSAEDFNVIANERQQMNAASFEQYWKAGSRADKTICSVAAEALKDFDFVKNVKVVLPTGKQTMTAVVDRDGLSKLTGKEWKELVADWDVQYTNGIVRLPDGRAKFMEAFVK